MVPCQAGKIQLPGMKSSSVGWPLQPTSLETNVPIRNSNKAEMGRGRYRLRRGCPGNMNCRSTGGPWMPGCVGGTSPFPQICSPHVPGRCRLQFIQGDTGLGDRKGLLSHEVLRGWMWTQTPFCLSQRSRLSSGRLSRVLPSLRTPLHAQVLCPAAPARPAVGTASVSEGLFLRASYCNI